MTTYYQPGVYRAKIQSARLTTASTGTPQLRLELALQALVTPAGDEPVDTTSLYNPFAYLAITPKTLGTPAEPAWVTTVLQHLGFAGDFADLRSIESWEGLVLCQHKPSKDATTEYDVWSIKTNRQEDVMPGDAALLNNRFKAILQHIAGKPTRKVTKPLPGNKGSLAEGTTEMDITEQDVPF